MTVRQILSRGDPGRSRETLTMDIAFRILSEIWRDSAHAAGEPLLRLVICLPGRVSFRREEYPLRVLGCNKEAVVT